MSSWTSKRRQTRGFAPPKAQLDLEGTPFKRSSARSLLYQRQPRSLRDFESSFGEGFDEASSPRCEARDLVRLKQAIRDVDGRIPKNLSSRFRTPPAWCITLLYAHLRRYTLFAV